MASRACSGVMPRANRTSITLLFARTAKGPPADVQPRISERSRRILQREFLGNHSAHRDAENMGAGNAGGIENCGCVRCHGRNRIRSGRNVAPSHASIVERDRAEMLRQRRPYAMPHDRRIAEAHDQQKWGALALFVPINLCSLIFDE
jgi:hypothetical protein